MRTLPCPERSTWSPRTPRQCVRDCLRCRRGAVAVGFVVTLTTILAMCFLAIDVARLRLAQTRLHNALDAAALAGTRDIHSPSLEADVRKVFDANFESAGRLAELTSFQVQPIRDAHGIRRLRLRAEARLASPLGALLDHAGLEWLEIEARNETVRTTRGLELVMVLDNTGSMSRDTRIADLRAAAHELTDMLFDGKESQAGLRVGIVPFVANVNIGTDHVGWLRTPPRSGFAPTTWKGCVLARTGGYDESDAPPSTRSFRAFRWPSMDRVGYWFTPLYDNDPSTPWSPLNIWPRYGRVDERHEAGDAGYGPNLGCGPAILPLSPAASRVRAKIDEMQPWHRGGTMANMGLVWGWRALSPRWDGLWRSAEGDAVTILPYDARLTNKAIILMTDGRNVWHMQDYTAYRFPQDYLLGNRSIDTRLLSVCGKVKNKDILLYTITFGDNINAWTRQLYDTCASAPDQNPNFPGPKYFHAPTGDDLRQVFGTIGGQLTELRLTQ